MSLAAVILWAFTAAVGVALLGAWLSRGGVQRDPRGRHGKHRRLPRWPIPAHALLAAVGLALWIAHLLSGRAVLAWVALGIVAGVVALGVTMFVRWLPIYRADLAQPGRTTPGEPFPVAVVALHGVLALGTVSLVLFITVSAL